MLRSRLKDFVAALLYRTGLLTCLVRRRFHGRAVVLTYHRVLPATDLARSFSHPAIVVSPAVFERHMAVLNRHFVCLSLQEFGARMQRRDFAAGAYCLVTFDDGWRDNYTYAFPVLRKTGTPAVIFVPTGYIGSGRLFWQERLGHLLARVCDQPSVAASKVLEERGWAHLPGLPPAQRIAAIRSTIRELKRKDYAEIDRVVADLECVLGTPLGDPEPDTYLDLAQMRTMAEHGIEFQSHAESHRVLTRLEPAQVAQELAESGRWLREHLGVPTRAIAYPNGDHSPEVRRLAAEAGYEFGFTTVNGCADPDADRYAVRRINLNEAAAGNEARLLLTLLLAG